MVTDNNFELYIKKHWTAFIIPTFLIILGLIISLTQSLFAFLGSLMIVFNIFKILSLRSVSWKLTTSDLYITSGIFPWSKTYIQIPIFDIYESYISYDMFGHFFGFGHITVRRTDGTNSQISETALIGVKEASAYLNQFVQDYKRNK